MVLLSYRSLALAADMLFTLEKMCLVTTRTKLSAVIAVRRGLRWCLQMEDGLKLQFQ
jgi:hypothetical protein